MKIKLIFLFAFLAILTTATSCSKEEPSLKNIRLVLFLTIDQFPYEYIDRFRPLYKHGLKTLLDQGALFTNMQHDHSDTTTCTGHTVLATGYHPSSSGIISNIWVDRTTGEQVYCVQDSKHLVSPKQILVTAIGDWLKGSSWDSKVFSVSQKDRSAITLGGKNPNAAFWYNKDTGDFISNDYYRESNPKWLRNFNQEKKALDYFGTTWNPLPLESAAVDSAGLKPSNYGDFQMSFPHPIGKATVSPNSNFFKSLYGTPFSDELTKTFAERLIEKEGLGKNQSTDLLAVSFSAVDSIGHKYGPHSREALDAILRVDKTLGELFDYTFKNVGKEHVLIVLSSDHGVQNFPEASSSEEKPTAHRQNAEDVACIQNIRKSVSKHFGDSDIFVGNYVLNKKKLRKLNIKRHQIDGFISEELLKCRMIEKVWTDETLLKSKDDNSEIAQRFRNNFHPTRSPDYMIQLKPNHLDTLVVGTNHGTPYSYDTHVPTFILGPGISKRNITKRIATIDVAPTIAELIGISPPKDLDGTSRIDLLAIAGS